MMKSMDFPDHGSSHAVATAGQRGPAEHERRQQILQAAAEHFRLYGYKKTTVGDLARAIGLSSAYIYKFFDSKQAIGEAVCSLGLAQISSNLETILATTSSPVECLRKVFRGLASMSARVFLEDRKIHELVVVSFEEKWSSLQLYNEALVNVIQQVVLRGRESGEFERKTSLEETCRAILFSMQAFYHPVLLVQYLDNLDDNATAVANLVLRSLAV